MSRPTRRAVCARCPRPAVYLVAAGDPATFWYRSECSCLSCLPKSRRWAGFVGSVTLTPVDQTGVPVQGALFDLSGREERR